jgi:plasmid stabilization system protein ParE
MKQKSRRQLRAEKKRQENQERREREIAELQASFLRLSSMKTSFSREPHIKSPTGRLVRSTPEVQVPYQRPSSKKIPSLQSADYSKLESRVVAFQVPAEEFIRREREAAEVTKRLKSRVAIPYNKGPYMFLSDETDPKDLGRK